MTNWILMPTLNCKSLTEKALESCRAQDIPPAILCIDASSDDGLPEYIRSIRQPEVALITIPRDAGVSRAWNIGLTFMMDIEPKAEAVLVVNSDVELRPDTYRLLLEDGGQFVTAVGSSTAGTQYPGGDITGARRPHPDFSCFLIRRECWEAVGKFDEDMRIYCSDGNYHLRMRRAGIDAYCIDLPFLHHASGTLKNADEAERERMLKQADQDRAVFMMKHGVMMGSPEYYALFGTVAP